MLTCADINLECMYLHIAASYYSRYVHYTCTCCMSILAQSVELPSQTFENLQIFDLQCTS